MTGSNSFWFANPSSGFYNGVATQSLRLDDGDNGDKLSLTHGSAGNQKTWTWSGWVKRGILGTSSMLYSQFTSNSDVSWLYFSSADQLNMQNYEGANQVDIKTNAKFRDPTAWYHIMAVLDTTQGTNTNRAKMYVNGELQTSLASTTYPTQNADLKVNSADAAFVIGSTPDSYGTGAGYKFDGYLAEVNFVDGIALDSSYFGETKNGVWIPKKYTGSHGTNGFRLEFKQSGVGTASASTIGADTSGNTNHLTSTNIAASDCAMPDSPENNFTTINSLTKIYRNSGTIVHSEGNLQTASTDTGSGVHGHGTFGMASGKWYWEVYAKTMGGSYGNIGLGNQDSRNNIATDASKPSIGIFYDMGGTRSPRAVNSGFTSYGASWAEGDIIGIAFDADNESVNFYKNGSAQGAVGSVLTQANGPYFAINGDAQNNTNYIFVNNFGQDSSFAGNKTSGSAGASDGNGIGDFYYSVPSGYLALCTSNLPEPTIGPNSATQADDYFQTVLYTGNATARSITGVGFQPDWVWSKARGISQSHRLVDSSRGVQKSLYSNTTDAEGTESGLTAFNADGFSIGTETSFNYNTEAFVAWNWKANGGTTTTNDASSTGVGSIDSVYQANTTAGFSIVTYTGTGSAGTIAHGLGKAPNMSIIKPRNFADNWIVTYDMVDGSDDQAYLNLTNAGGSPSASYVVAQNATTLGLTDWNNVNDASDTYVAYCFHSVEGYSKFGSYTGNGNANGTFVFTGFRPAWILIKVINQAGQRWELFDSVRSPHNPSNERLSPNIPDAEHEGYQSPDFLSNGFKLTSTSGYTNDNGNTYIYMAFAEAPFKYANAR